MNENLNLVEILKDCPEGIILYSTLCGTVTFKGTAGNIIVGYITERGCEVDFNKNGSCYGFDNGECILFPSKDNRDWSTFKVPTNKEQQIIEKIEEWIMNNTYISISEHIVTKSCYKTKNEIIEEIKKIIEEE